MVSHPKRGRASPEADFTKACVPDLYSMPKPVQAAGWQIRRSLEHISAHIAATVPNGLAPRPASYEQAGTVGIIAVDLGRYAYHVWAQTSSISGPITPLITHVLTILADPDIEPRDKRLALEAAVSDVWRPACDYIITNGGRAPPWRLILSGQTE